MISILRSLLYNFHFAIYMTCITFNFIFCLVNEGPGQYVNPMKETCTISNLLFFLQEGPSVAEMVSILGKRTSLNRLHICKVALADKSKFKNMEELSAP